jgi:competence protein ComEA
MEELSMQQISAWLHDKRRIVIALMVALGAIILGVAFFGQTGAGTSGADTTMLADEPGVLVDALPAGTAPAAPSASQPAPAAETVVVYISGAVRHPDVYQVPAAARVKDVVLAAGGLTEDAAAERINLAEHVADAQHVHIPRQGEAAPEPASGDSAAPSAKSALIDLNTASAADLDTLAGIGQSLAQRIVEYRTTNGPFQSVEDLQKVKGIGPALFAKIASSITVGP